MDSDDDIYEPNEETNEEPKIEDNEVKMEDIDGDVEEGEEEEDSSDDDINFITDAKAKPLQPEASSYVHIPSTTCEHALTSADRRNYHNRFSSLPSRLEHLNPI